MSRFTIGIPTFNRAELLSIAIEAALSQSYPELEIIVSDNASTDETPTVVRQFGDRVRYVRNESNIGAVANFRKVAELATGEFFSWLQDDDCIFASFAEHAVAGLREFPGATVYGAYAAVSNNLSSLANGWLYGPPIALDWFRSQPRTVRGDLVAPLSLAVSFAIPPVIAFRTAALKQCLSRFDADMPLFVERTILADVASLGEMVVDPFLAGVFRSHAKQGYRVIQNQDPDAMRQQWLTMAKQLDSIVPNQNGEWRGDLIELLRDATRGHKQGWIKESETWPTDIPLCREMRAALLQKPEPTHIPLSPSGLFRASKRYARTLISNIAEQGFRIF